MQPSNPKNYLSTTRMTFCPLPLPLQSIAMLEVLVLHSYYPVLHSLLAMPGADLAAHVLHRTGCTGAVLVVPDPVRHKMIARTGARRATLLLAAGHHVLMRLAGHNYFPGRADMQHIASSVEADRDLAHHHTGYAGAGCIGHIDSPKMRAKADRRIGWVKLQCYAKTDIVHVVVLEHCD